MQSSLSKTWCADGRAISLPEELSLAFHAYLLTLPWWSSTLRWSEMPASVQIDLSRSSADELITWSQHTRLGQHAHLAVWFSAQDGGIVVERELALRRLDELYWGAPGVRFAFAVDVGSDGIKPDFAALLQYGAGDLLIAVAR